MNNKKIIAVILTSFILVLTIIILMNKFDFNSGTNQERSITLLEAYNLARNKIQGEGYYLFTMTSADILDYYDEVIYEHGNRRFWNLMFNQVDTSNYLSFHIRDGQIIAIDNVIGINEGIERLIKTDEITLDSPEAFELAFAKYTLLPGNYWALGHHFTLNRFPEGIIIGITGYDENDNFRMIQVNLNTLEIILN
jgi:hypothetical protein